MNAAFAHARQKREWRQQVAARLIQLADGSALPDTRTASRAAVALDGISLDVIDTLPLWCALNDQELERWQHTTGALFITPALRRCLDGATLKKAVQAIGESLFQRLLKERELPDQAPAIDRDTDFVTLIRTSGAHILLSLLPNVELVSLYAPRLGMCTEQTTHLDITLARHLYLRTAGLLSALDEPDTHPHPPATSRPGPGDPNKI